MGDRCPRCGGSLKPGALWCGLCYADLRPPPPEPPAAPAAPEPVFAPVAAATPPPGAEAEPGEVAEGAGAIVAEARKGWPCVECGTVNAFEHEVCLGCGLPFGSALRTPPPSIPGDRRTRIGVAVGIVVLFMAIIALVSAATTEDVPTAPDPTGVIVVDG